MTSAVLAAASTSSGWYVVTRAYSQPHVARVRAAAAWAASCVFPSATAAPSAGSTRGRAASLLQLDVLLAQEALQRVVELLHHRVAHQQERPIRDQVHHLGEVRLGRPCECTSRAFNRFSLDGQLPCLCYVWGEQYLGMIYSSSPATQSPRTPPAAQLMPGWKASSPHSGSALLEAACT